MAVRINRVTSFILVLVITISIFATLGLATGASLTSAASSSATELWLKEDYDHMMVYGERRAIDGGAKPYRYMGDSLTIYVPVSALVAYMNKIGGATNWTLTVSGDDVTLKYKSVNTFTMRVGELWLKKNGTAQADFLLPVVKRDGQIYLSNASICSLFSVKLFWNRDTGLIVYAYNATPAYGSDYESLSEQIDIMSDLLYYLPTADEVYSSLVSTQGSATAHPRIMADQDRFDALRAAYTKNGTVTSEEQRLIDMISSEMTKANSYFVLSFAEKSGGGAEWKDAAAEQYYWQPYYIYDENGNRLIGVSEYTWKSGGTAAVGIHVQEPGTTTDLATLYAKRRDPWRVADNNCGYGYDAGGRSTMIEFAVHLRYFAFAYQITREQKWVDAFWLAAQEFGEWEHWGEGHFLDCADGSCEFALGYDWIYPALNATQRQRCAEILFTKGVEVGYYGIQNRCNGFGVTQYPYLADYYDDTYKLANTTLDTTTFKMNRTGNDYLYQSAIGNTKSSLHASHLSGTSWGLLWNGNNWQTVCSSGMAISALAVMGEFSSNQAATDICSELISLVCTSINRAAIQYAPDGSYIESPGYWGYGTNTLMEMIYSLETCLGDTYGFLDMVGLRGSYYFAVMVTDPSFYSWNYHDGTRAQPEGYCFYMASRLYGDPNIAFFRDMMLEGEYSIKPDILDILAYDESLSEGGSLAALDYYGKSIETVTMRSAWNDKSATFTGLHAGANYVSHGDVDSGNFYLYMGGELWFNDKGSENYNIDLIGNYFTDEPRYYYYRKSAAAHNLVYILDSSSRDGISKNPNSQTAAQNVIMYGQILNNQKGKVLKTSETYTPGYASFATSKSSGGVVTEQYGSYAFVNMQPQYGQSCTAATRGVMLTNSRETVVLQDEMTFSEDTTLIWQVNYNNGQNQYYDYLSDDGRTAYFQKYVGGEKLVLRASIISEDKSLKFELKDQNDPIELPLVCVYDEASGQGTKPGNRLTIKAENVREFNVAVVFELIKDEREIVGYEYKTFADWETKSNEWVEDANAWLNVPEKTFKYKKSDMVSALNAIKNAATEADKIKAIKDAYKYTTDIDTTDSTVKSLIREYMTYYNEYSSKLKSFNAAHEQFFFSYMKLMLGFE